MAKMSATIWCGQHLHREVGILVADLAPITQPEHRRPVRTFLLQQRGKIVIDQRILHSVHEHVDTGAERVLLILYVWSRARVPPGPCAPHLSHRRTVRAPSQDRLPLTIAQPDLDVFDALLADILDGGSCLGSERHLVVGVEVDGVPLMRMWSGAAIDRHDAAHEALRCAAGGNLPCFMVRLVAPRRDCPRGPDALIQGTDPTP